MGLFAAFLAACFSAAKDLLSKRLSFHVHGTLSAFASFLFALPYYGLLLFILWATGNEHFEISKIFFILVILRSTTDTFAEWLRMHAIARGDISLIAGFLSLQPLFMLVASPLITGDVVSTRGFIGVVLTVAGTLVVLKPSTGEKSSLSAILLATASSVFLSLNSCFDRLAVQHASPTFSAFAMTLLSALFLFPFVRMMPREKRALGGQIAAFSGRGFFEIAFMVSKLYALRVMQAPYVAGILRGGMLVSVVGGKVFFHEPDFVRRLISGLLIVCGMLMIIFAS